MFSSASHLRSTQCKSLDFNILLWIAGYLSQDKKDDLQETLLKSDIDVFDIMETNLQDEQFKISSFSGSPDLLRVSSDIAPQKEKLLKTQVRTTDRLLPISVLTIQALWFETITKRLVRKINGAIIKCAGTYIPRVDAHVSDKLRREVVAAFRLFAGHDCLAVHLYRIGILTEAACPCVRKRNEPMDEYHLRTCGNLHGDTESSIYLEAIGLSGR
ncbi:hypothetical protein NPIL_175921 [Nephila pilipes]|uniref:Uncharacterized protein n=1 Tax=Nephila pilipes TaxID=299642 RepID=A0A8X6R2S0_NEPPI|nr:hypothetical protein NPIL_175921 [Nephila pilipes]